ncbi:MAG: hypothetical protein ACTSWY_13330 [Promethearchaeota archaeon]
MKSAFIKGFDLIREEIDKIDKNREKILRENRTIIRNCSEIIKSVHRKEFQGIKEKIGKTKDLIFNNEIDAKKIGYFIGKNYLSTIKQEYTEAVFLYYFASERKMPTFEEIGVNPYEYVLGLADVVGELKRMVLNNIRMNNFEEAENLYNFMDELYQLLFGLDYPSGLLPGFRRKVDVARNITRGTLELITTSKNISVLNENLEKTLKDNNK